MKVLNYCNMHIKNKVTYLYIISSIMYIHSGDYIYNKENYTINNSLITPITDNNKNYINPEYKTNNIEDYLCQYYNENILVQFLIYHFHKDEVFVSFFKASSRPFNKIIAPKWNTMPFNINLALTCGTWLTPSMIILFCYKHCSASVTFNNIMFIFFFSPLALKISILSKPRL